MKLRLSCVAGNQSELGALLGRVSFNYKPPAHLFLSMENSSTVLEAPLTSKAGGRLRRSRRATPGGPARSSAVRYVEPRVSASGGARSRRGATHRLSAGTFCFFRPTRTLSAVLWYLLQPRLGMGLFTRVSGRKLLSGTVFAKWFMLLSRC